ncbi:MAG TPA: response regulator [Rectinemataceae bacterium]|nr:response regulator [Rectinemataceae bacterium]
MSKKILICEDNPVNRVLLHDILAIDGYEIIEASDGEMGFRLAGEAMPDLVIMDIQMPVMNGYDAMRALRSQASTSGILIIALTSFAMPGDRERALDAGANEYLSKPIDTRQVRALVRRMMGDEIGILKEVDRERRDDSLRG